MNLSNLLNGCTGAGRLALIGMILLMCGCRSLIFDPRGHLVPEEKWIAVPETGAETGVFENEDLTITYKMVRNSGELRILGEIRFADRISKNFPTIQYFHLGALLLNDQGRIIEISNLASVAFYKTQYATIPDYPLVFNTVLRVAGNTRFIAFQYTGRGLDMGDPEGGGTMDFWEYPVY